VAEVSAPFDSSAGESLFAAACARAELAASTDDDGAGVAAAALTASGRELVGVWVDAMVDSACLCAETGPICEAHQTNDPIVASVCVRSTDAGGAIVLPACGVCQERLVVFGADVMVAVGRETDGASEATVWRSLTELRPSPWWDAVD